jgi:hypothetical protein
MFVYVFIVFNRPGKIHDNNAIIIVNYRYVIIAFMKCRDNISSYAQVVSCYNKRNGGTVNVQTEARCVCGYVGEGGGWAGGKTDMQKKNVIKNNENVINT